MGLQSMQNMIRLVVMVGAGVSFIGATCAILVLRAPTLVAINVVTDPPRAEVIIDGHGTGFTPLTTAVTQGEHRVTLRKAGFQTIDRKVYADRSAPEQSNDFSFGLEANSITSVSTPRSALAAWLKLRAQEAYRRGDLVAPEKDNALYYVEQLAIISPDEPFVSEMRERIRQALKQRAEAMKPRNDLARTSGGVEEAGLGWCVARVVK